MDELLKEVKQYLVSSTSSDDAVLSTNDAHQSISFDNTHFTELDGKLTKKSRKSLFIDGGQAELFSSAHFSLGIIRLAYVLYEQRTCVKQGKSEFYVFITQSHNKFSIKLFPIRGEFFPTSSQTFDSFDKTLMLGSSKATPSSVLGVVRRFGERELAGQLTGVLHEYDRIILDGNLTPQYTGEEQLLQSLFAQATEKNIEVVGLCKTTSTLTQSGEPLSVGLSARTSKPAWIYQPLVSSSNVISAPLLSCAKLSSQGSYVFMVESFTPISLECAQALSYYASDPVFLGYPYGLITVDRLARVSKQEATYIRTRLRVLLGKEVDLESYLRVSNAHDVLDSLSF